MSRHPRAGRDFGFFAFFTFVVKVDGKRLSDVVLPLLAPEIQGGRTISGVFRETEPSFNQILYIFVVSRKVRRQVIERCFEGECVIATNVVEIESAKNVYVRLLPVVQPKVQQFEQGKTVHL